MNESIIANVATAQRRRCYANILMNESTMTNVLTTQLGTSCSFDSPGLASEASYPAYKCMRMSNAIGVALFKLIHHESPRYPHVFSEKAQHLWR